MSGCGRKHRAKHLTRQFLNADAWTGPRAGQRLGLCMAPPQGQQVRVYLLPTFHDVVGGVMVAAEPEERVVPLPRKFHKVIWLAVKDMIVMTDEVLELKLSPDQLKNFIKSPDYELYRSAVEEGKSVIESKRKEVERVSGYGSSNTPTTTSVLQAPEASAAPGEEEDGDLSAMANPNRRNIKHRQQFFFGVEESSEEEEEEEEEEEGRVSLFNFLLITHLTNLKRIRRTITKQIIVTELFLSLTEVATKHLRRTNPVDPSLSCSRFPIIFDKFGLLPPLSLLPRLLAIVSFGLRRASQAYLQTRCTCAHMDWVPFYASESPGGREVSGEQDRDTSVEATLAQMFMDGVYRLLPTWEDAAESEMETESKRADSEEDERSSLSILVGNWLDVHQFFLDVPLAEDDAALAAALPGIAAKLRSIHRALLAERNDILVQLERRTGDPSRSASRPMLPAGAASMGFGYGLSRSPAHGRMAVNAEVSLLLPPCYQYLFGTETAGTESPATPSTRADEVGGKQPTETEAETETETETDVYPPSVGSTFLALLCQYAKLNHPPGSRQMLLTFLAAILYETDIPPPNRLPGGGAASLSLLQLSPTHFIVPLLDMVRQISAILDPGGHRRSGAVQPTRDPLPSSSSSSVSDGERAAFVLLLCVLAEKTERIPDLANFFMTSAPAPSSSPSSPATHCWADRRDTCRLALSAVLSLAKCPDAWVRDVVAEEKGVLSIPLATVCTTLCTLCKVPDNEDSRAEMLYLRDAVHYVSALCHAAPEVGAALGVLPALRQALLTETLLPLLKSADSRTYACAALVTASLIKLGGISRPAVRQLVVEVLLSTTVAAGRLQPPGEGGTSFWAHYVLPHLSATPRLTPEDKANMAAFGYDLTPWTAVEATLVLLDAVATHCPATFLKEALRLDLYQASGPGPADALPALKVDAMFPASLQSVAANDVVVGTEVLRRLLIIESNLPPDLQEALPRRANAYLNCTASPPQRGSSGWFDAGVHAAPTLVALEDLVRHFLALPASVAALLTDVVLALALQPDPRVLHTMLDPGRGRLSAALAQVQQRLDKELDEEVASPPVAAPPAAAARQHKKSSASSWLWKTIAAYSGDAVAPSKPSSSSERAVAPLPRKALFLMYSQLPSPPDFGSAALPPGLPSELQVGMAVHRQFLEAATCLEGLRKELSAAVGYVEMSRQLMRLQPGLLPSGNP
eukprot:gene8691-6112_t